MGWVIVGTSFVTLALVYSIWYSFSVFFVTLLKEFGWSRSLGAGAFSFFGLVGAVIGPFVGGMVSTLGPRKVILFGSLFLGMGLVLTSFTQNWWQFYLFFGFVTAIGLTATGWVPNVTLIQIWFKEKRGLATGTISSGIGIGIFICVPAIQYLILRFGWRVTYRLLAVLIPLLVISMALLFLKGLSPKESSRSINQGVPSARIGDRLIVDQQWASRSWDFRQAIRTKQFWVLGFSFFVGNFITQSVFTHQVAFFVDHGLEALFASSVVGMVGLVSIGSKILWGTLSDKIGREITYTLGMICFILGMLLLISFDLYPSRGLTYFYSVCFGMGYAVTAALPPLMTADFFEGPAYGRIFGSVTVFLGVGGALGAWFAGLLYDWVGSYVPVFIIMAAFGFVSCLGIWNAAPRRIRRVPGKLQKMQKAD